MTAVERYNALDGETVKREEIQKIAVLGAKQGQTKISLKLFKLLEDNDNEEFKIKLSQYELDNLSKEDLPGLEYAAPDEEFEGLQKAVSPDEIYQYITDLMINTIKEVGDLPWQREWDKTALFNGYQATNFKSKKGYRGINFMLLNFEVKIINGVHTLVPKNWENPFFLTFNQIEKNKGQLTKGSKGKRVIYFTQLYTHSERNKTNEVVFDYSTYNKKKFAAWAKKNQHRIHVIKSGLRSLENFIESSYLPILKYYNVFNGEDITGIDWGTLPKNENVDKPEKQRIEIAEKIIELYPNKPQIIYKGDQPSYYPLQDQILMTPIEAFKTEQSYYTTLFHECIHSTGHSSRLKRGLGASKKGDSSYAFEELIAELGAVFLSAESGILFQVRDNSAKYLKGWNSRLVKAMKDDNRFFFRASSKAQAGSDYILDRDKKGIPAYQNSIKSGSTKKVTPEKNKVKSKKSKVSKKLNTNELLEAQKKANITAKNKGEFEKGLKKMGFDIFSYDSNQTSPKEWERTYKLNFKDVTGLELKMSVRPEGKEIAGEYSWKAFGIDTDSSIDYENLQQFYEEILAEFKEVFAKASLTEIDGLRKEYSKTLHKNKEPKAQLGLFGTAQHPDTIKFNKEILAAKRNGVNERKVFHLGKTNSILKEVIGNSNLTMPAAVIKKAMTKDNDHIAGWEHFINLPDNLNKPLAIFESASSGYVVLTELKNGKHKPLMAALHVSEQFKITKVASLYARSNIKIYDKWANEGELLYQDKKKGFFDYKSAPMATVQKNPSQNHGKIKSKPLDDSAISKAKDKKKSSSKKKGLKSPGEKAVATVHEPNIMTKNELFEIGEKIKSEPVPVPVPVLEKGKAKSLDIAMNERQQNEIFQLRGDLGRFLGQVEKKPVHSVVTTLDAEQGAGKTRFLFQAMNALAGIGLKCLFYSLEEHPSSKLFKDKVDQYIDLNNLSNIGVIDEVEDWEAERKTIENYDIIFIDSFQKLPPNLDLDKDIRKAFNGKWFFVIYQQTGTKGMRGGSKAAFDGDQILKVSKDVEDYRNNYIYANKNRYNDAPDLKFNIFSGKLQGENPIEDPKIQDSISSSNSIPESGRLIATPVI